MYFTLVGDNHFLGGGLQLLDVRTYTSMHRNPPLLQLSRAWVSHADRGRAGRVEGKGSRCGGKVVFVLFSFVVVVVVVVIAGPIPGSIGSVTSPPSKIAESETEPVAGPAGIAKKVEERQEEGKEEDGEEEEEKEDEGDGDES